MNVLICDSAYPPVVEATLDGGRSASWREATALVHTSGFGTWNSLAHALQEQGRAAESFVLNLPTEYGDPFAEEWDAIVIEDIGRFTVERLRAIKASTGAKLVGHFSHAAPAPELLAEFDLLISAFPHYVRDFGAQGLPIRYLPLAFDPRRRDRIGDDVARDLPLTFVGGIGYHHWKAGLNALNAVAEAIPEFQWWGMKGPLVSRGSPLEQAYQGEAYGHDYFRLLARSQATIHRHGEVHFDNGGERGDKPPYIWACSMRIYEATGMGACLLTESARNLGRTTDGYHSLFEPGVEVVTWNNPTDLVLQCQQVMLHADYRHAVAASGQGRTLAGHTYARRAAVLADWLADV